jgi:hypothetical protein
MSGAPLVFKTYSTELALGEVDAFSIPGLKCYFGSNDHYPQHFEVLRRGKWLIRVFFLRCTKEKLAFDYKKSWGGAKVSAAEKQVILDMVRANRRRLLREWSEKVCCARDENDVNHDQEKKSRGGRHD